GKTLTALAKSWNSYGFSNSSFLARAWVLDISTKVDGKRQRTIKAFGKGPEGKAAAVAYAAETGTQAKSERYRERQTATFRDLWDKFAAHELIGPTPGPSAGRYAGQATTAALPRHAPPGRHARVRGRGPAQARPGDTRARGRANHARDLHPHDEAQARRLG